MSSSSNVARQTPLGVVTTLPDRSDAIAPANPDSDAPPEERLARFVATSLVALLTCAGAALAYLTLTLH